MNITYELFGSIKAKFQSTERISLQNIPNFPSVKGNSETEVRKEEFTFDK